MRFGLSKEDNMQIKTNGTPMRKKVKHRQSARHCDCFHETPDRNLERHYILGLITKSLPPISDSNKEKKKGTSNKNTKKQKEYSNKKQETEKEKQKQENTMKNKGNCESESKWTWKRKTNNKEKDPLKRVTSITLRKNQIVPLEDGSGACALVSQLTTITEKPCGKEKQKKYAREEKKRDVTEDNVKSKLNIFQRLATIKRRFQKFMRRKSKTEVPKAAKENAFVEFENIPLPDDFIEECFPEDDLSDESGSVESVPVVDAGRISVCSSGYFTPLGESPSIWKLRSEDTEEVQSFVEGEVFEDADHDSGFVDSICSSRGSSSVGDTMAVDNIKTTLDAVGHVDHEELRRRLHAGEPLYPNNDCSVWMRTCEEEIIEPIRGKTTGN